MRHITYAIILGFIIPLVGIMTIGPATDYMTPSVLTEIKIQGEPAPGILLAPLMFPVYFIVLIHANNILPALFDNLLFRVTAFTLPVWTLYGVISYFLLGRLKRFRKQSVSGIDTPPAPPSFENEK
jgi:hypothetical protein